MPKTRKEPEFEPCEICGTPVVYCFSLCRGCDDNVRHWDEDTGYYHMKDGRVIDTTKFLHLHEGALD